LARYSVDVCIHATALRLSSATSACVDGLSAGPAGWSPCTLATCWQPESSRTEPRMANAGMQQRMDGDPLDERLKCSRAKIAVFPAKKTPAGAGVWLLRRAVESVRAGLNGQAAVAAVARHQDVVRGCLRVGNAHRLGVARAGRLVVIRLRSGCFVGTDIDTGVAGAAVGHHIEQAGALRNVRSEERRVGKRVGVEGSRSTP